MEGKIQSRMSLLAFKAAADSSLTDLWSSLDVYAFCMEIAIRLKNEPHFPAVIVKRLISSSLDGTESRIVLATKTLSALSAPPASITSEQMCEGWAAVMESVEDLEARCCIAV